MLEKPSSAKGQTNSKWFFQADIFLPKNEWTNSTLLVWHLRLTSFRSFFGRNWRYQKDISKLTDLYLALFSSPSCYQSPKLNGLTGAHLQAASLAHQQSLFAPPPSPWNWNHNSAAMAVSGMNNLSNLYSTASMGQPQQVRFSFSKNYFLFLEL